MPIAISIHTTKANSGGASLPRCELWVNPLLLIATIADAGPSVDTVRRTNVPMDPDKELHPRWFERRNVIYKID